jgi:hypothetical protein
MVSIERFAKGAFRSIDTASVPIMPMYTIKVWTRHARTTVVSHAALGASEEAELVSCTVRHAFNEVNLGVPIFLGIIVV